MNDTPDFGFARLWAQGDAVTHAVALLLLAMSVAAWYWTLARLWVWQRLRPSARHIEAFWEAADAESGLAGLRRLAPGTPAERLAAAAAGAAQRLDAREPLRLADGLDRGDALTRALRRALVDSRSRLERGLTLLASIGATAPFVGLFGTVWGIYHALVAISVTGQATLDKVAGPVGEALVMTAAGIGVALPAVLAYNAIGRLNRELLAELDAFARDLHACFTAGARPHAEARALRVAKGGA
ncbi:MAG: MotA/TolQ/ExbB proton channel family protein [Rhodocyclales bacterium]|nr:MotA/TolQ/ExbB proton channel family protein [Rhodocyclales bacterium]